MASTRESLLSELGFLDSYVMDEKPKDKSKDETGKEKLANSPSKNDVVNEEAVVSDPNEAVLKLIEGMDNKAALAVIGEYRLIPEEVKRRTDSVYSAMRGLGGKSKLKDVKEALMELKKTCGEHFTNVYNLTLKDAKKIIGKIATRQMEDGLE